MFFMQIIPVLLIILIAGCSASEPQQETLDQVPQSASEVQPLLIGESVPDLPVADVNGNSQTIMEWIDQKPTLIILYRGGWCPYCSAHLSELASIEQEIYDLDYQILAISPDQPEYLRESVEDEDLNYTLLSDSSMEAARAFGVAYRVDDETVANLKDNGMDIVQRSGQDHRQLPVPAAFITSPSGKILFQYVNPDYRERISGDILMAALRSFNQDN